MLLVQLGINSTRDVWKFAKLDSPRRLVQFWQNFQTSLVLLIPNCTRHRMITYTYNIYISEVRSNFIPLHSYSRVYMELTAIYSLLTYRRPRRR
jgi:hypothetical protein